MSRYLDFRRGRSACVAIAVCFAVVAIPAGAQAAAVNLGTTEPFVVLSGSGVENTGLSVLNGDLGVSPGTSVVGFGPGIVNGVKHENDGVAAQAQSDLTTAYNVAAGQSVPGGNNLTGTNLGTRTLTAGIYGYSSSALLNGQLTLDAQGDPNAQFVFKIGSSLTTGSASSVILTNGASPCNVFWQVGETATFGTTTTFVGTLMALESITLTKGANVLGRLLARNGDVTLIEDTITRPLCATGSTPTATESSGGGGGGGGTTPTSTPTVTKKKKPTPKAPAGTATVTHTKSGGGVNVTVRGKRIAKVTVRNNGNRVGSPGSPRKVHVPGTPGLHTVTVQVKFKGSTKTKTVTFHFRVPTPVLHPPTGPSQFTG